MIERAAGSAAVSTKVAAAVNVVLLAATDEDC
jgi:hypothetical protein